MFSFDRMYSKMNLLDGGAPAGGADGTPANVVAASTDTTGNNAPAPTPGGAGLSWDSVLASLPQDLRDDASLKPVKDVQTLVKNYVSAQKMVGRDKISVPDPKFATKDDWMGIFKKLGAVDKLDDFKFKLPEGAKEEDMDPEFMASVKKAALESGVLPWQFEGIYGAYHKFVTDSVNKSNTDQTNQVAEDTKLLKAEWGQAFDDNVKKANIAFKELVPNGKERERLIEEGFGNNPVLLKMLANAAKFFNEDTFIGHGAGTFAGISPKDAHTKALNIIGDDNHPYRKPEHPAHRAAKDEVRNLMLIAFPNKETEGT